jgi:hypothetical protein
MPKDARPVTVGGGPDCSSGGRGCVDCVRRARRVSPLGREGRCRSRRLFDCSRSSIPKRSVSRGRPARRCTHTVGQVEPECGAQTVVFCRCPVVDFETFFSSGVHDCRCEPRLLCVVASVAMPARCLVCGCCVHWSRWSPAHVSPSSFSVPCVVSPLRRRSVCARSVP